MQKPSKPTSMGYLQKFQSIRWSLPYILSDSRGAGSASILDNRTELHRHLSEKTHKASGGLPLVPG